VSEISSPKLAQRREAAHPSEGHQGHNTTPAAWIAVFTIIAAFILGGVALIEWVMWLFWVAVGVAALGSIGGAAARIMDQVTEYGGGGRGGDPGSTVPN
jgi:hypothetical protein